jgi:hypothetical protein
MKTPSRIDPHDRSTVPPAKFWQLDNEEIVELIRGVAPQNFFNVLGCTCHFFGGIVSLSLLPSSTKTMANGSLRAISPAVLHERIATSIDYMVCGFHGLDIERRWQCRSLILPGLQTLFEESLSRNHYS